MTSDDTNAQLNNTDKAYIKNNKIKNKYMNSERRNYNVSVGI